MAMPRTGATRGLLLAVAVAALAVPARANWTVFGGTPEHQLTTAERLTPPLAVLWKHASMTYSGDPNVRGRSGTGLNPQAGGGLGAGAVGGGPLGGGLGSGGLGSGALGTGGLGSGPGRGGLGAGGLGTTSGSSAAQGGNLAGAVISNGVAFFASRNRLFAVDANTGELKWRVPDADNPGPDVPRITATPAVSGDFLYVPDAQGNITAYSTADGTQLWPPFHTGQTIRSSPIVVGDALYFGSDDDFLYCLDARSGQLRWKSNERGRPLKLSDDIASSPTYYAGVVYVNSADYKMWAFNAESGRLLWVTRLTTPSLDISPVAFNNRIFLAAGTTIYAFRARGGGFRAYPLIEWLEHDISTTPVITEEAWYVADRNGNMYAFNNNGRPLNNASGERWKVRLEGRPQGAPVLTADTLYVATDRGFLHGINVARGELTWTYRLEAPRGMEPLLSYYAARAPLAVTGGKLFVVSDDGTLTCLSPNAPDDEGPVITSPRPSRGTAVNGNPPVHISAYLWDEGSGINPDTIELMINEVPVERDPRPHYDKSSAVRTGWVYDPVRRRISYSTPEPEEGKPVEALREGVHKVTIQAADWRGNVTALEWTFTADRSVPKPVKQTRQQRNRARGGGIGGMMGGRGGMMGGMGGGMMGPGGFGGGMMGPGGGVPGGDVAGSPGARPNQRGRGGRNSRTGNFGPQGGYPFGAGGIPGGGVPAGGPPIRQGT
jgi:outer membrane protein assembly factor BamB